MKIIIGGASGVIGSALVPRLRANGHRVVRLVRETPRSDGEIAWQAALQAPQSTLSGADAVIHLGGEPIIGRWTAAKKARIRSSRTDSTRQLSEAIASLQNPPRIFLHASAIGIYGDRGDEILTESSASGSGFLAEVCRDWEAASQAARDAGIRVVAARIGIVLDKNGGALRAMLPPFRAGVGGHLGDGNQWWSWISLEDAVRAILFALQNETISGAMNVVAPQPQTSRDFADQLARALHRSARLPVPAFLLRAAMGEAAEEMLLSSQRIAPKVLLDNGFRFAHPDLTGALASLLA